ncbi:MAG: PP2C family protein-serine/threonine phosphatase, partial [Flavobacteriales bacterium]
ITIVDTFRKKDRSNSVQDGMDITICAFDRVSRSIEIAAANNRAYIIGSNGLTEVKGDHFSIGSAEEKRSFINQAHQVKKGDTIYLFSDGFASQFGGESGKKLKYSRMKEMFLKYSHLNMKEQQNVLQREMETWKGGLEQIDDILVMGIRIA